MLDLASTLAAHARTSVPPHKTDAPPVSECPLLRTRRQVPGRPLSRDAAPEIVRRVLVGQGASLLRSTRCPSRGFSMSTASTGHRVSANKPPLVRDQHGDWSAAGHRFGDDMRCFSCGINFSQHQREPEYCPNWQQCRWKGCREPVFRQSRCERHYVVWDEGSKKRKKKLRRRRYRYRKQHQ